MELLVAEGWWKCCVGRGEPRSLAKEIDFGQQWIHTRARHLAILSQPARETPCDKFPQSTTEMKLMVYQDRKRKKLSPQLLLRLPKWYRYIRVQAIDFTSNQKLEKTNPELWVRFYEVTEMLRQERLEHWRAPDIQTNDLHMKSDSGFGFLHHLIPSPPPV